MLLMGRTPIVSSRFRSHQGLSPTRTPETTRAVNRGQRSGASTATAVSVSTPGPDSGGRAGGIRREPPKTTAISRAMPEVAQAVRPVARDLEVDGQVAADLRGRLVVQTRQGEPFGETSTGMSSRM